VFTGGVGEHSSRVRAAAAAYAEKRKYRQSAQAAE